MTTTEWFEPVPSAPSAPRLGAVVIGRNEGERLRRCLQSVLARAQAVVYVDSGSTDDSLATAAALGARTCQLDMRLPFTAARARNEGARRLLAGAPGLEFIQFVDGDCEIVEGWLDGAQSFLDRRPDVAAVCGRRRERFPERSIYNLLCDIEWNTPVGETKAFGGDVLMRTQAFQQVAGFRDDLIAGEEPELCVRLRARQWRIWRLDAEMTLHDAAMTSLRQWWMRSARTGFAFAEGVFLHGAPPERHWVREWRSAWLWGLGLPLGVLALTALVGPVALLGFAVYPLQVWRLFARGTGPWRTRLVRAAFLVLGKFAEAWGQLKFLMHRLSGTRSGLIEYK